MISLRKNPGATVLTRIDWRRPLDGQLGGQPGQAQLAGGIGRLGDARDPDVAADRGDVDDRTATHRHHVGE